MFGSFVRSFVAATGLTLAALAPLAMPTMAAGQGVATLCADVQYGGGCQVFDQDVPSLFGTTIGNDRASSVQVAPGTHLLLYSDINYGGVCQDITANVPSLFGTAIGNDSASSLRVRLTPDGCGSRTVQVIEPRSSIGYLETTTRSYFCPGSAPFVGDPAQPAAVPFRNNSTSNVSASLSGGGYGAQSINVTFTDWLPGEAWASVVLTCHS